MQAKLRAIIIDDEPIAISGLEKLLQKIEFIEIVGTFDDANDARELIENKKVEIMFLDIEMPAISGIDFLKSIDQKPVTIITSAYPQYAIDGYELEVLDYLIKPITPDRLLKSLQKAQDYLDVLKLKGNKENYIFLKCEKVIEKIFFDEILYVESLHNYVAIYTLDKKHVSHTSLKNVELMLPADYFIKVQKSFIVSISKITGFDKDNVIIKDKHIPISRSSKKEINLAITSSKYINKLGKS